jgi:hypothetical protein
LRNRGGLWTHRDSVAMIDLLAAGQLTAREDSDVTNLPVEVTTCLQSIPQKRQPFTGGTLTFYEDRVELCGAVICSGTRSKARRAILELLSQRRFDGTYCSYSGDDLREALQRHGVTRSAAGLIRDLRDAITRTLSKEVGLECGREVVILSGGAGYRLSQELSVQHAKAPTIADIGDINVSEGVPNVANRVRNTLGNDVANPLAGRDSQVAEKQLNERQVWIIDTLQEKGAIKIADVKAQFSCSTKTARRDLSKLVETGEIEHEGETRNRCFRLRDSPMPDT